VFLGIFFFFLNVFWGSDFGLVEVFEKKIVLDTEKGGIVAHYCAIPLSQPPFIAYSIAQYISPTPPFIAIKYWQYLVRVRAKSIYVVRTVSTQYLDLEVS